MDQNKGHFLPHIPDVKTGRPMKNSLPNIAGDTLHNA